MSDHPDLRRRPLARALMDSRLLLLLVAAALTNQTPAQAQTPASLVVTAHTLQGQAVPKAAVTVQTVPGNAASQKNPPRVIETGASGEARFTDLPPGRYRLTIL